ncbi:pro-resilin-like [Procambarus clarkii]|uniref:pro-resilin-like n=1 Tax=Procambarus clarkii TaxID=6728 RepID=UPI00374346D2
MMLCLAAAVTADRRPTFYAAPQESSEESYESSEAQYNFNYAVKHEDSGNDFGHQETRDGDNTKGSYYVQLPDGRLQTVTYYVDGDSGYVAQVSYQGEARYPDSDESYESREAPRYAPPRPTYG